MLPVLPRTTWLAMPLAAILLLLFLSVPVFAASSTKASHSSKRAKSALKSNSAFLSGTTKESAEGALLRKTYNHPLQRWRENIITTVFYIGEYKKSRVGLLNNRSSAWSVAWVKSYGGVDTPKRSTIFPKFKPKENPFYFALPLSDKELLELAQDDEPEMQELALFFNRVYSPNSHEKSNLKNTWIAIQCGKKTCYAQWQDVGPYNIDDADYVLSGRRPKDRGPALDISPAVQKFLRIPDKARTRWRFVSPREVPQGPWLKFVSGESSGELASLR